MKSTFRQFAAKGFTLIELLIVVIIIAILAAIAIPQFGNSTNEATDAALDANLNTVRSAIELYRVQHNNNFPAQVGAASAGGACPGNSPVLVAGTEAAFIAHLTMVSNRAGQVCSVPAVGFDNGPYLRAIPRDPVTPANNAAGATVAVTTVVFPAGAPAAGVPGWRFNTVDGRFQMNSPALDRNNVAFFNH
jgi:general secretion pathway protein G